MKKSNCSWAVFSAVLLFAVGSLFAAGPAPQLCSLHKKFYEPFFEIYYCDYKCPDGYEFDGQCSNFSGATVWNCPGTSLHLNSKPGSCPTKAEWAKRQKAEKARIEKEAAARRAEEAKKLAERRKKEKEARDKYAAENAGTFVDSRDGRTYKTTVVDGVTWMAENLKYADSVAMPSLSGKTACYGDNPKNCEKYGRLYSWSAAMDSVTTGCGMDKKCKLGGPLQGICPDGWRIPMESDLSRLMYQATKDAGRDNRDANLLMSLGYPEWDYAADLYSFSAIPAGYYEGKNGFTGEGTSAKFWGADYNRLGDDFGDGVTTRIKSPTSMYIKDRKDWAPHMDFFRGEVPEEMYGAKYSVRCLKEMGNSVTNIKVPERIIDDSSSAYPVVRIGNRVWQAHNMGMAMPSGECNEDPTLCKKHGRYYDRMDASKVCPAGWHLPTLDEWDEMFADAGSSFKNLMKKGEKGWPEAKDSLKFSVPASGYWVSTRDGISIKKMGYDACYWVNNTRDFAGNTPSCIGVSGLYYVNLEKEHGSKKYSVRCIMDEVQDSAKIAKWDSVRKEKFAARKKYQAARKEKIKKNQEACKLPKGCPFTDKRDGKTYNAAAFGEQVWMTENLDFEHNTGRCFNDGDDDCGKSGEKRHGKLYRLIDSDDEYCPEGWRVPTMDDFKELVRFAGGEEQAAIKLKSNLKRGFLNTTTLVWGDGNHEKCLGNDELSFSALPVGIESDAGEGNVKFWKRGYATAFWYINPNEHHFNEEMGQFELSCKEKNAHFTTENYFASIRCIKSLD